MIFFSLDIVVVGRRGGGGENTEILAGRRRNLYAAHIIAVITKKFGQTRFCRNSRHYNLFVVLVRKSVKFRSILCPINPHPSSPHNSFPTHVLNTTADF